MHLSFVILSYNRKDCLKQNLLNLYEETKKHDNVEIIVVDNNSSDGTRKLLKEYQKRHPSIKIILNNENFGVAGGRNKGYKIAKGDFIVSIDDDTELSLKQAFKLIEFFDDYPQAGILAPKIRHKKTGKYQYYHGEEPKRVGNFHGSCRIYRKEVLEEVGYLDENCTFGGEELEFSIRCRDNGYEVFYIPYITSIHDNTMREGGIGKKRRSLRVYNFLRIHHKHFKLSTALTFNLRYFISHFYSGVRKYGFLFSCSLIFPALRGIIMGRKQHKNVSDNVQNFFKKKEVEPDFGNKPVLKKMFKKLKLCKSEPK